MPDPEDIDDDVEDRYPKRNLARKPLHSKVMPDTDEALRRV